MGNVALSGGRHSCHNFSSRFGIRTFLLYTSKSMVLWFYGMYVPEDIIGLIYSTHDILSPDPKGLCGQSEA